MNLSVKESVEPDLCFCMPEYFARRAQRIGKARGMGPLISLFLLATVSVNVALAGPVARTTTEAAFSWIRFLGPFHMVVLHYPIGLLSLAALMEIWAWRQPEERLRRVLSKVLALAAGSAVIAASLGWLRAQGAEYDSVLVGEHQRLGLITAGLSVAAWSLHGWYLGHRPTKYLLPGYRMVLALAFGCLLVTGHHGGSLTHGRSFLSENAPRVLRPFLGPEPLWPTSVVEVVIPSTSGWSNSLPESTIRNLAAEDGEDYYSAVKAVFIAKCYSCHGPEKQKSQFRLDERDVALKGGKSGIPAVVPGDPFQSNLVRLCLLPRSHDDVMPPEGKEGMTAEEILTVVHWIQAGAPWN